MVQVAPSRLEFGGGVSCVEGNVKVLLIRFWLKLLDLHYVMVCVIGSYCFHLSCCGFCYVLNVVVDDDVDSNMIGCAFSFCHDVFL